MPCARVPRVSRDVLTTGCSSCATESIISTKFSAGCGISSKFSCLLSAVSQSVLFMKKQICFFLGGGVQKRNEDRTGLHSAPRWAENTSVRSSSSRRCCSTFRRARDQGPLSDHCDRRDGVHAVLRVSGVVSIFNCRQSAKFLKELVNPNEAGCVSA